MDNAAQLTEEDLDSDDYNTKFTDYFKLIKLLGRGAFGFVVSAVLLEDKKVYAVKV